MNLALLLPLHLLWMRPHHVPRVGRQITITINTPRAIAFVVYQMRQIPRYTAANIQSTTSLAAVSTIVQKDADSAKKGIRGIPSSAAAKKGIPSIKGKCRNSSSADNVAATSPSNASGLYNIKENAWRKNKALCVGQMKQGTKSFWYGRECMYIFCNSNSRKFVIEAIVT